MSTTRTVTFSRDDHVRELEQAVRELADELGVSVHRGRGPPSEGEISYQEAIAELSRRYRDEDEDELAAVTQHMGRCGRCGHQALDLEGGICPRCRT